MPLATETDAMDEYARNMGDQRPDSQWLLTNYDVWVINPHYVGPPQRHPEEDPCYCSADQLRLVGCDCDGQQGPRLCEADPYDDMPF